MCGGEQCGERVIEGHSEGDGSRHGAVFWLLSTGNVASSEQTKYWSQLNITFPCAHKPSRDVVARKEGMG